MKLHLLPFSVPTKIGVYDHEKTGTQTVLMSGSFIPDTDTDEGIFNPQATMNTLRSMIELGLTDGEHIHLLETLLPCLATDITGNGPCPFKHFSLQALKTDIMEKEGVEADVGVSMKFDGRGGLSKTSVLIRNWNTAAGIFDIDFNLTPAFSPVALGDRFDPEIMFCYGTFMHETSPHLVSADQATSEITNLLCNHALRHPVVSDVAVFCK